MKRLMTCLLVLALAASLCVCVCGAFSAGLSGESAVSPVSADYEHTLFDTRFVHKVDVCLPAARICATSTMTR